MNGFARIPRSQLARLQRRAEREEPLEIRRDDNGKKDERAHELQERARSGSREAVHLKPRVRVFRLLSPPPGIASD